MRWVGHVARMGVRNAFGILVDKAEGKIQFGRHTHKWDGGISVSLNRNNLVVWSG
jgi:hypothetical protein